MKVKIIVTVIILVGIIIAYGNWSFNKMVENELQTFKLYNPGKETLITEEMIIDLPPVVQRWLINTHVIGREKIYTVQLEQIGELRTEIGGKWMPFEARQWIKTEAPGFIWWADVTAGPGLHLAGRDKYNEGKGHMLIKLLSLFPVADAEGEEIDQGTLLRYLAETVWFPTAALNEYIQWEQIDSNKAKATMAYGDIAASGVFSFDAEGNVVGFEAKRYYERKGVSSLEDWVITIEPNQYKEYEGIEIPIKSTVTWKLDEGDFTWLKLEVTGVRYNQE